MSSDRRGVGHLGKGPMHWTSDRISLLVHMRCFESKSTREIAAALNISKTTVCEKVAFLGLPTPTPAKGVGVVFTSAEDVAVTDLWAKGFPVRAIGRKIGRSHHSIVGRVKRLRLPARPSPIRASTGTPEERAEIRRATNARAHAKHRERLQAEREAQRPSAVAKPLPHILPTSKPPADRPHDAVELAYQTIAEWAKPFGLYDPCHGFDIVRVNAMRERMGETPIVIRRSVPARTQPVRRSVRAA